MKSRDEILDLVKAEMFSTRRIFFDALDELATQKIGIKGCKPAWPDALTIVSLEDWNSALAIAMAAKAARTARSASESTHDGA